MVSLLWFLLLSSQERFQGGPPVREGCVLLEGDAFLQAALLLDQQDRESQAGRLTALFAVALRQERPQVQVARRGFGFCDRNQFLPLFPDRVDGLFYGSEQLQPFCAVIHLGDVHLVWIQGHEPPRAAEGQRVSCRVVCNDTGQRCQIRNDFLQRAIGPAGDNDLSRLSQAGQRVGENDAVEEHDRSCRPFLMPFAGSLQGRPG